MFISKQRKAKSFYGPKLFVRQDHVGWEQYPQWTTKHKKYTIIILHLQNGDQFMLHKQCICSDCAPGILKYSGGYLKADDRR